MNRDPLQWYISRRGGGGVQVVYAHRPEKFLSFFALFQKCLFQLRPFFNQSNVLTSGLQSCKLYDNKYMIASTKITNIETFAFIVVAVFKF